MRFGTERGWSHRCFSKSGWHVGLENVEMLKGDGEKNEGKGNLMCALGDVAMSVSPSLFLLLLPLGPHPKREMRRHAHTRNSSVPILPSFPFYPFSLFCRGCLPAENSIFTKRFYLLTQHPRKDQVTETTWRASVGRKDRGCIRSSSVVLLWYAR